MRQIILISLCGWFGAAQAQFDIEKRASELHNQWQFSEAFRLWQFLAEESEAEPARSEYMRFAVEAAVQMKRYEDAFRWSEPLLKGGQVQLSDVENHLSLLRVLNRSEEAESTLDQWKERFNGDVGFDALLAQERAIQSLLQNERPYEMNRFRPGSEQREFCATPYGEGLIFISSNTDVTVSPWIDGWTGEYFTELSYVQNTSFPEPTFTWRDELQGMDLFRGFGYSRTHDGPVRFDQEEDYAVLTRNQSVPDTTSGRHVVNLQLELFWKRAEGWQPAYPFPWNSPKYSCGHGTFNRKGDLIFMSDIPGGFGGTDLYRCKWENGEWSKPENLGAAVNTDGNEVFPFVSKSGNLYFSSDGHVGLGGLDVYVLPIGTDRVEHLGAPLNSFADDFDFQIDEETGRGWMSSNRDAATDAIYQVQGESLSSQLQIEVLACDGSNLPGAGVEVRDLLTSEVIQLTSDRDGLCEMSGWKGHSYNVKLFSRKGLIAPPPQQTKLEGDSTLLVMDVGMGKRDHFVRVNDEQGQPLQDVLLTFVDSDGKNHQFLTNEEGLYEWTVLAKASNYSEVTASFINYEDIAVQLPSLTNDGCPVPLSQTISLEPVKQEMAVIDLNFILYDLGSSDLRPEAREELDKLVNYMSERPEIRVELSSHTDCRSDEESNLRLSQARAESCIAYIISKGISAYRIEARGYGESQLLNRCSDFNTCGCAPLNVVGCDICAEEMHQQNRRTELRLLAEDGPLTN